LTPNTVRFMVAVIIDVISGVAGDAIEDQRERWRETI
jgi:hypothetical protein